jgi:H/ACA ribonucleoprotein complex non-core subunit NAF1
MGKTDATSQNPPAAVDDDEGDDEAGATSHANYLATKNEAEPAVSVPDIEAVGAEEVLEIVGEIVNIMDQVVIVRGQESDIAGRGSDKALDSGTLLVFEDRTVLGHVSAIISHCSNWEY